MKTGFPNHQQLKIVLEVLKKLMRENKIQTS